jgi:hypothetical protein
MSNLSEAFSLPLCGKEKPTKLHDSKELFKGSYKSLKGTNTYIRDDVKTEGCQQSALNAYQKFSMV